MMYIFWLSIEIYLRPRSLMNNADSYHLALFWSPSIYGETIPSLTQRTGCGLVFEKTKKRFVKRKNVALSTSSRDLLPVHLLKTRSSMLPRFSFSFTNPTFRCDFTIKISASETPGRTFTVFRRSIFK